MVKRIHCVDSTQSQTKVHVHSRKAKRDKPSDHHGMSLNASALSQTVGVFVHQTPCTNLESVPDKLHEGLKHRTWQKSIDQAK